MQKNLKIILIVGAVLGLVAASVFFLRAKSTGITESGNDIFDENVIPTVDPSVDVGLETVRKGEVRLTIANAPEGTRSIEYEVTYDARNPGGEQGVIPQGAIGKCSKSGKIWECKSTNQENIILGTCSSGTCIYHNVVGKVKVLLKFTGSYGQRIFEKEYELE